MPRYIVDYAMRLAVFGSDFHGLASCWRNLTHSSSNYLALDPAKISIIIICLRKIRLADWQDGTVALRSGHSGLDGWSGFF